MSYDFTPNKAGYEVLTPDGFKPFAGVAHKGFKPVLRLTFGNRKTLTCTADHRLFGVNGVTVRADALQPLDWVLTGEGRRTRVKAVEETGQSKLVFDLIDVADDHRYVTNGILSHNCDFVTDDETLINPLTLTRLRGSQPIYYTNTVRWFAEPTPNRGYLVSLDPSLGTGRDHAAIQVFQIPEMLQVAEWQHNGTAPRGQVRVLLQTLTYLDGTLRDLDGQTGEPEIYWSVENNSIGEALLLIIEDTGEERFPGFFVTERKRKGQTRRLRKGMTTNNKNKLAACARLKSLVESGRLVISSSNLIKELKSFVGTDATFKAKPGEHDDLVMALLLIVRMLDVALLWGADAGDLREHIDEDELLESGDAMPVVV